jgi:hypothetical protein
MHNFLYVYVVILYQQQGELLHISVPDIKIILYTQNIYRNIRRI